MLSFKSNNINLKAIILIIHIANFFILCNNDLIIIKYIPQFDFYCNISNKKHFLMYFF